MESLFNFLGDLEDMEIENNKKLWLKPTITIALFVLVFGAGVLVGGKIPFPFGRGDENLTASLIKTDNSPVKTSHIPKDGVPVLVSKVIDGDTIFLETGEKVRYIGIDAPEKFTKDKSRECFAEKSFEINRKMVEGKKVILESDVKTKDIFSRTLAYVYLADYPSLDKSIFVNAELAEMGAAFAVSYPPDTKYQEEIAASEKRALEKNLGLWGACGYSAEKRPIPD